MIYWRIGMSLLAILLFTGTIALSLWATMRVRQAYHKFSLLLASFGINRCRSCGEDPSEGRDLRCGDRGTRPGTRRSL